MNNPPYILVDEMEKVVLAVKTALALPVLNYQYGYITELRETLNAYDQTAQFAVLKFPLIWLQQPFTIDRDNWRYYGKVKNLQVFIINETGKTMKSKERMTTNFKPIINPIYYEFIKQLEISKAFVYDYVSHNVTDRYYWGEDQYEILYDVFDCTQISGLSLKINNNLNCP